MEAPVIEMDDESDLLKSVFPDSNGEVFAEWFTGTLKLARGTVLKESNSGLEAVYEEEIEVEVKEGSVVFEPVHRNRPN